MEPATMLAYFQIAANATRSLLRFTELLSMENPTQADLEEAKQRNIEAISKMNEAIEQLKARQSK